MILTTATSQLSAITTFATPEGFIEGLDYRIHAPGYEPLSFSWGDERPIIFSTWPNSVPHTLSQGQQRWPLHVISDPKSKSIDLCLKTSEHLDDLIGVQNFSLSRRLLFCLGVSFLALCVQFHVLNIYLPLLAIFLFSIVPNYSIERRWQVGGFWMSDQKGVQGQKWFSFKRGGLPAETFFRTKGPHEAHWRSLLPQHPSSPLPPMRFHIENEIWGHVLFIHFEPKP